MADKSRPDERPKSQERLLAESMANRALILEQEVAKLRREVADLTARLAKTAGELALLAELQKQSEKKT
jgi:hypothetical protein